MKMIQDNLDKPWDWSSISMNPNITFDITKANSDYPWDWNYIISNPNITIDIIEAHPDKGLNWCAMLRNPNFTMKMILANLDKDDDWDFGEYPDKPWNWKEISNNNFNKIKYDKNSKELIN